MSDLDKPDLDTPELRASIVRNNAEEQRYELLIDGAVVGIADYREEDGRLVFPHTQIDPRRRGHGLGARLVAGALDDVRLHRDEAIVPACWFVDQFISEHPDYAD